MEETEDHIIPPTPHEVDQAWEQVIGRIRTHENRKRKRKTVQYIIAASIIALFTIGCFVGYNNFIKPDEYSSTLAQTHIRLKDGTLVTLFKGSKLTVEKSFPADTRDVYLDGDAIFKVSKSKEHPFLVHGNGYQTKVLGTIFKVIQNGKTFKVDLYEGKVQINRNDNVKEVFELRPKETFSNMGSSKIASVIPTNAVSFGKAADVATLSFNNVPLAEAIRIAEKTYNITINYPPELADSLISVNALNANGDDLLQMIALRLNLKNKEVNDQIFELEK